MQDLLNNPGFLTLMGTLFGGVGLKVIESQLNRARNRAAESATARDELRKEIEGLRVQLQRAAAEEMRLEGLVDEWREKYFTMREEKQAALTELQITLERLKHYRDGKGPDGSPV